MVVRNVMNMQLVLAMERQAYFHVFATLVIKETETVAKVNHMFLLVNYFDLNTCVYWWFYSASDINECVERPCDRNAVCSNEVGSFVCMCNNGYSGTGLTCLGELIAIHSIRNL